MTEESSAVDNYVRRLNGHAWGVALGMLFGVGLFLATLALVIRGGEDVGAHLGLLSVYFPFYDVTVGGSFLGFMYGFLVGYLTGRLLCAVYNLTSRKSD